MVAPPVEDFLHRFAEDDGRQNGCEMTDHGMLIGIAVLILVHDNPTITCKKHIIDVSTCDNARDRRFNGRVIPPSVLKV